MSRRRSGDPEALRRRACDGKVAYPGEKAAARAARWARRHGGYDGLGMHHYKCPFCPRWHIGHDKFR